MAHFIGTVKGYRREASRLGSKKSGLIVRANGWDFGIHVVLSNVNGEDVAHIHLDHGSSGKPKTKFLGRFTLKDLID